MMMMQDIQGKKIGRGVYCSPDPKVMEEYANYGFSVMEGKLKADPSYFFSHRSFLDIFLQLTNKQSKISTEDEEIEEL